MQFIVSLFVLLLILFLFCLIKFESTKLECHITTLSYAIAVNIPVLQFSSKKVFRLTTSSMLVSLNQYRGEIGSFYNWLTSQITELTISLFKIIVCFTENVSVNVILIVNTIFLTLPDQFSTCNVMYLSNFMTYFTLGFWQVFRQFFLLMLCEDIKSNTDPRLNSGQSFSNCHWNLNSIVAHYFSKISLFFLNFFNLNFFLLFHYQLNHKNMGKFTI